MGVSSDYWFSGPGSASFASTPEPIVALVPTLRTWQPPPTDPPRPPGPVAQLLEDIGDLEQLGTLWQAAGFAAAVLMKRLAARAVMIHALDETTSELRIIAMKGARTTDLLGETVDADEDFVGSTVLWNRRPLTMTFDEGLPRVLPPRFRTVRAERSLLAMPVLAARQCLAVIEVIDVAAYASPIVVEACTAVGERLLPLLSKS